MRTWTLEDLRHAHKKGEDFGWLMKIAWGNYAFRSEYRKCLKAHFGERKIPSIAEQRDDLQLRHLISNKVLLDDWTVNSQPDISESTGMM